MNLRYSSGWFAAMFFNSVRIFLTLAVRILASVRFCWSISRLTLSGRSSLSMTPRTKRRYWGKSSLASSMMKTRSDLNTGERAVLLEYFAADIERKVFAIDDAANKAQILGQKFPGVVHDEDTFYLELDANLVFCLVEVEGSLRRYIEKCGVFKASFGFGVKPEERILYIASNRFVELLEIIFADFILGPAPKRTGNIDLFGGTGLDGFLLIRVPIALVVGEEDGKSDVVGILLDDLLQTPAIGILLAFFVEVKQHGSAGDSALCRFDFETRLAIADPTPGLLFASLAGYDLNSIGNHEGAVEANAKLAYKVRVPLGIPG